MSNQPIILLTFAKNDLNSVSEEAKQIHALVSAQPLMEAVCVEDANKEKLGQSVADIGKRLRMYHFSGHANPHELVLDDFMKLDKIRFSRLLKSGGGSLDFVFLNGCHSYGHVAHLTANRVKAVIVTSTSIGDRMATKLSIAFYKLFFTKNYTLQKAFEGAEAMAATGYIPYLHIAYPGEIDANVSLKAMWTLVINEDYKEVIDWRLEDFINPPKNNKIPRLLTANAGNPSYFLGREADLAAIATAFSDSLQPLFLVNGEGGIGKTTLASRYWHLKQSTYKHLGWLNAASGIKDALLSLQFTFGIRFEPQDTPAMQLQKMVQQLNDLEHPVLLVFDNADDSADLEAHFMVLQQLTNCHLLITTRVHELADARVHQVKPLSEMEALKLFAHHYKALIDNELALLKNIFEAVGYNTLVIELLAKNLKVLNRSQSNAYPIARLLEDLQTKGLLAILTKEVQVTYQSQALRKAKPEEIIRAMYDLHPLSAESVYLLNNFAVLPSVAIPFETFCDLLKPTNVDACEANLADLRQKGWIRFDESEDGYKVSSVVQAVVRDKNKDQLREDCDTLIDTLKNKLERDTLHEENYKYSPIFAHYAESVVSVFSEPDWDMVLLTQGIGNFHTDTGNLKKALDFYLRMKQTLESLCETNPKNTDFKNGLAISYSKLGETHASLGHLEQALTFYEAQHQLGAELYAHDPKNVGFKNGLAISYSKLGETHTSLGHLEQALTFYESDLKLCAELYALDPSNVGFKNGLASSYFKLGETYASLGHLEQALSFYEAQNKLAAELYAIYPLNVGFKNGLASSYSKLGETRASLGHLEQALTFYESDLKLCAELYALYPSNVGFKNGLAISYEKLGETHASLGHLEQALTFYESETVLFEELYALDPSNVGFKNGLAISYSQLGETHASLGHLEQALPFYEDYKRLSAELYALDPKNVGFKNGLAVSYYKLGTIYKKLNQQRGIEHFKKAETLWIELVRDAPMYAEYQKNLRIIQQELMQLGSKAHVTMLPLSAQTIPKTRETSTKPSPPKPRFQTSQEIKEAKARIAEAEKAKSKSSGFFGWLKSLLGG
jgi:tetratricopeptide (TPR) repeat protein